MVWLRMLFEWADANLPGAAAIRESSYGFSILLTFHVVFICLFLGSVIMMDLRLVGLGPRRTPFSQVQKGLFPWQMLGMALASISGAALLYIQPMNYYGKGFFWTKLGLMVLAGLNAQIFHATTYRSVAAWDIKAVTPRGAQLAGVLSLVLWAGVLVSGRLVAYDWWTYFQ